MILLPKPHIKRNKPAVGNAIMYTRRLASSILPKLRDNKPATSLSSDYIDTLQHDLSTIKAIQSNIKHARC